MADDLLFISLLANKISKDWVSYQFFRYEFAIDSLLELRYQRG